MLQALEAYGQGLDFADALHLLRSEGCAALVSLDRAFAAKAGELALTPAVRRRGARGRPPPGAGAPRTSYRVPGAGDERLAALKGYWQELTETLSELGADRG